MPDDAQYAGPVLIAGGSSELGLALAAHLRQRGLRALAVCRSEVGVERCREAGLEAIPLHDPETLPQRAAAVFGEYPAQFADLMHSRFESLLAGASPSAVDEWAATDIALRARLLRAVGRGMLARESGRCVFVSSSAAGCPAPGQAFYAAAKLAGESLYRSLGCELSSRGVTACSLRLSWLDAGRGKEFLSGTRERAADRMPGGRLVTVREAVRTLAFLLSIEARSINGTTVTMDGGLSACKPALKTKEKP